ncbi:hypothetical protein LAZ67_X004252 [Cordylochernes scorpioides]|uniref:HTH CENPB-type domain-containing protein n=1 Tax=Cordylochernes scorpioides TaxID=51811 RepID=A0ABY6LVB0_9ARAC|nr:hypothetical protein LAZ67_X004252 [Cordylochernes scorpioides]
MPGHRKRRQFKQTDAFTRGMVIGLKRAGWSIRQIAADTHLGASTVHRLWRRWLEQGNVAIYRNVGATRVTSARVDRRIRRQAVAAPQATCTAILQHVQDTLDHSISTRTISRRLVANGLHSCHESRFCLSSDSRRVRVWRRRGERSNPAAIVERPTVRQRGIMVWGAIAYDSRSPLLRIQGTMTAQRYVDDVLRPVTLPYLQGMLPWPPYSPDLSPIEHVWDIIGRRLHALPQPRSEDELWQMVEREWRAIHQDAIRTLIDSLPRRVAACIARPRSGTNLSSKISSYSRGTLIEKTEKALVIWIEDLTQKRIPLDGHLIKMKALKFYKELKESEPSTSSRESNSQFSASTGWLTGFIKRHSFHNLKIKGEVASADEEAARKYPEKLAKIIKDGGYCAHQIFNADETGLFWKKMPTRTYIAKSEKNASGFKAAKDRVTLLLCSNASGNRMLKPLLVNRSLKPRPLKGKDLNTLPVHWMANKKAWVTTAIFTEWFNKCFVPEVENYMKEMGLEFKILLILDNAPGHPNLEHPNIKVVFFPPNTTSLIQPLDQGIISTFKKYDVKFTFQFIFDKLESDTITVTEVWKQFNILNCVDHVALAIAEIKSQTLNACWKAAWPECVSKRNESNRTTIVTSDIISIAKEIGGEALNDDDILESMVDTTKDFETVDSELEDVTPLDEKLLREGLQFSGKLEIFFIQNDNDVERALKFQRDLKFCMSGYRELYKELVKPSQRLITDYLVKEKKITEVPKEALPCRSDDVILSSSDESDLAPIHKRVRTLSDSE